MSSEKILKQKQEFVSELTDKLKRAASGVLVDYRGLTVAEDTELRNELRKAGVEYKVIKNTMLRFAAKEVGFDELDTVLENPTSLAISYDDAVAPAKVLSEFAKKHTDLEIKAGFVDGKVVDAKEIDALAKLPSKEVLVAKALGGLNAPISGFVCVLNANLRGLVCALDQIAKKQA